MTPFPPKTPAMIRREAEDRRRPQRKPQPPGEADPAARPALYSENPLEAEATADWLAHIAAGRIAVK
jgi:hypothetical protein